jgi:hypothetical protein
MYLHRVGRRGDVGDVEISDLLFTSHGPTAGAIFMVSRRFEAVKLLYLT